MYTQYTMFDMILDVYAYDIVYIYKWLFVCMYIYTYSISTPPQANILARNMLSFVRDSSSLWIIVWLIHMCDMTHSHVSWIIHTCDMINSTRVAGTWFFHTTHSYVRYGMTCPYVWRDVTRLYTWHNSCIRVAWLIRTREKTHLFVWHDLFICVSWLTEHWYGQSETWMNRGARRHDSCHIWMSHATHRNASCHIYDTGVVDHRHYDSLICVTCIIHMCDMTYLVNLSNRGCVM